MEDVKRKVGSNDIPLIAKERMSIDVETMSGENLPYDMVTTDVVADIKRKLQLKLAVES